MSEARFSPEHGSPIVFSDQNGGTELATMHKVETISVVANSRLFRNNIARVLEGVGRSVIAHWETLEQVLAAEGAAGTTDLFVISSDLPGSVTDTFAQIRQLRPRMPNSRFILLIRRTDLGFVRAAVETGIEGLLLEGPLGEGLVHAVDLVLHGHSFVQAELARVLSGVSIMQEGDGMSKRIMIVAGNRLYRDGLERVLEAPQRVFVGSCETLDDVRVELGRSLPPDLFIVSLMASEQTSEALSRIREVRGGAPASRWLVLGRRIGIGFLREAVETGIDGLLLEDCSAEVLQLATELVLLGHSFVPAELVRTSREAGAAAAEKELAAQNEPGDEMLPALPRPVPTALNSAPSERPPIPMVPEQLRTRQVALSHRENEILKCLVAGHSNKLIARELQIAEATVKVHVKGLLRKMQVSNRTQAAISALHFLHASGRASTVGASSAGEEVLLRTRQMPSAPRRAAAE